MLWRSMFHVFLAQAILAWIYIIWPLLKRFIVWLDRRYSPGLDDDIGYQDSGDQRKANFRGKWREYEDQAQRQKHWHQKKEAAPERPPLTPRAAHLSTLGLKKMANKKTLRQAYRKLAKKWHPDRFATAKHSDAQREAATDKMGQINEAYDWLVANSI